MIEITHVPGIVSGVWKTGPSQVYWTKTICCLVQPQAPLWLQLPCLVSAWPSPWWQSLAWFQPPRESEKKEWASCLYSRTDLIVVNGNCLFSCFEQRGSHTYNEWDKRHPNKRAKSYAQKEWIVTKRRWLRDKLQECFVEQWIMRGDKGRTGDIQEECKDRHKPQR